jgi:adenine phosphoribosyltransferase|tara:strand:+ start:4360 stop:4890 length:531 start_codon:yes stop_codon:yes gene_type:complete
MNLKKIITTVPDFPVEGIQYKDITSILENPKAFQYTVDKIVAYCRSIKATDIVAPDARGFIWGAPVALALGIPLHIVRKPGKLPPPTYTHEFTYEYAETNLNIKQDAKLGPNSNVCIIDDVSATGGTASAIFELLQEFKVMDIKYACVIDLTFLQGTAKLTEYCGIETYSVVEFDE